MGVAPCSGTLPTGAALTFADVFGLALRSPIDPLEIAMKKRFSALVRAGCMLGAAILVEHASAQTFPTKPVRLVVPFPAGGAVDTVARAVGQQLALGWKQQVLVDNRPGAGGNIGADVVAKSAADGYTLLITTNGLAISPSLYRKLPFDAAKDFAPVTQLTSSYLVLVANPKFSATNFKELIDLAKAKPGQVSYGSTGIGVAPHLMMELMKSMTGTDLLHVPYKGDAQVTPALMSGEVQVAFMPTVAVVAHIKAGRLRGLGVTPTTRVPVLPDIPTIAEAGLPGFEYTGWLGALAPSGTPRAVVNQIQRDMAAAVGTPDIKERMPTWGYEPIGSSPEQFAVQYQDDIRAFAKVVKDARIPMQE
jgi:tripartite-type tricarboxylate transporter receptor subunit TctC